MFLIILYERKLIKNSADKRFNIFLSHQQRLKRIQIFSKNLYHINYLDCLVKNNIKSIRMSVL